MCATGAEARFIEGQRPVTRKWWAVPWVAERWKVRSGSNPVSTSWFRASKYRSVKNGQLGSDVHLMMIKTSRGGYRVSVSPRYTRALLLVRLLLLLICQRGFSFKAQVASAEPWVGWKAFVGQDGDASTWATAHYPASWAIKFLLLFPSNPTWCSTTDP